MRRSAAHWSDPLSVLGSFVLKYNGTDTVNVFQTFNSLIVIID